MPSFFEVARNLAAQDAQANKIKIENALNQEMLPYAADKARLGNDLMRGQISEFPYINALRKAQTGAIPSEIEARLAQAALARMQAQYVPLEYGLKSEKLGIDKIRYSPEAIQSLIDYRNSLIATAPQRALSGYGKQILEQDLTESGLAPTGNAWPSQMMSQGTMIPYRPSVMNGAPQQAPMGQPSPGLPPPGMPPMNGVPADGRPLPITTNAVQDSANNYRNKNFKSATDPQLRAQLLAATNVEKTLQYIDPKILGRYAGVKGKGDLAKDKLLSLLPGGEHLVSPEFNDYNTMVNIAVKMLSAQMLRFNKDSVQPAVQEKYNFVANPNSWYNSPELTIKNYNELVDIMNNEIGTLRDAGKNPDVYYGRNSNAVKRSNPSDKSSSTSETSTKQNMGNTENPSSKAQKYTDADIKHTAKKYGISEKEVRKKLGL